MCSDTHLVVVAALSVLFLSVVSVCPMARACCLRGCVCAGSGDLDFALVVKAEFEVNRHPDSSWATSTSAVLPLDTLLLSLSVTLRLSCSCTPHSPFVPTSDCSLSSICPSSSPSQKQSSANITLYATVLILRSSSELQVTSAASLAYSRASFLLLEISCVASKS